MSSQKDPVTEFVNGLNPQETIALVKDFTKQVEDNINASFNSLQSFDKAFLSKIGYVNEVKEDMKEALQAAYIYINNIDDFVYYGQCTLFEEIKEEIRKGNSEKLEHFFTKMEKSLQYIGQAHESYVEKCNKVCKTCTLCSESCALQHAEVERNREKSLQLGRVLGVAGLTAAVIVTFPVFGPFTVFAAGTVVGSVGVTAVASLTKAVLAVDDAQKYQKQEESFKKMCSTFNELSKHGTELKQMLDDLHEIVVRYETNHKIAITIDRKDQEGLCTALDKLKSLLQLAHSETLKARNTLRITAGKQRMITKS